jgi:hypothetical protein
MAKGPLACPSLVQQERSPSKGTAAKGAQCQALYWKLLNPTTIAQLNARRPVGLAHHVATLRASKVGRQNCHPRVNAFVCIQGMHIEAIAWLDKPLVLKKVY